MWVPGILLGLWMLKQVNKEFLDETLQISELATNPEALHEKIMGKHDPFPGAQKAFYVCPRGECDVFWDEEGGSSFCSTCEADLIKVAEDRLAKEKSNFDLLAIHLAEQAGPHLDLIIVSVGNETFTLEPIKDLPLWREIFELAGKVGEFDGYALDDSAPMYELNNGYNRLYATYWAMLGVDQDSAEELTYNLGLSPWSYDRREMLQ